MIYKVYLIDANNGISILESNFKEFQDTSVKTDLFPGFFNIINKIIDKVQQAMLRNERVNELLRVIEAEQSNILIFFHPESKVLFCCISDPDDDINILKGVTRKIASRFWKKHQSDLRLFRSTSNKSKFQSIIVDIENLTMGGKIAEIFPKILVVPSVLDKIYSMGLINDIDLQIALKCNGINSPRKISLLLDFSKEEVNSILKKLKDLDIISL